MEPLNNLNQAKILYRKYHDQGTPLSTNERAAMSLKISDLIHTCLKQQAGVASFKYLPFIEVIKKTVETNMFHGERAAMAFTVLEKYLLLLAAQPWKKEFRMLKTYGGYFRTKVKAHLDSPEDILQLVGYMKKEEANSSCLVLDNPPDTEVVLNVAFDCQVANEECLYIGQYYDQMKCVGLSLTGAMDVLLSGTSNDPVVRAPLMVTQGKGMQLNNNCMGLPTGMMKQSSRGSSPAHTAQNVMTPGGIGMMGTGVMHQVTGVPATHPGLPVKPPSYHSAVHESPGLQSQSPLPYPHMTDHPAVRLKVDLPVLCHPAARSTSVHLGPQMIGSRASYASTASAQSSGYSSASGTISPSSAYTASSAFTASSGYNSSCTPLPQMPPHNYTYPPSACHVEEYVSTQLVMPPGHSTVSPRHSGQLPLPQRSPNDFPYIDEGEPDSGPPFPGVTQEEHLRETFRNLQTGPAEDSRNRFVPVISSASEVMRHPSMEGMYDWQRSRNDPRLPPSQPAIAVARMVNPDPKIPPSHTEMLKRHASSLDGRPQRMQSTGNPAFSAVSSIPSGPLSESAITQDRQSQPIYSNQPEPSNLPFQRYANTASDSSQQHLVKPTFAQMAASGPKDSSNLQSRQAHDSPAPVLSSIDRVPRTKPVSSGRETSGSSSEVIMREKLMGKPGHVRGSSLVTQQCSGPTSGVSRQNSQSMDLGMLKWRCRTCTMENSALESICGACSKSKDAPEMPSPLAGESKRICPACTFENPSGHAKCDVCQSNLSQDVHTYV